ncbi:nicotinamide phosphoribosyltransferase [Bajunvirus bajun]|uniref:Nicotinamide phosphoribosyltransferase n=1 Tax=Brevundimonas phage vB_BgoS-Bajun TaxID=2948594 RepID=A0A9E7N4C5_9CAUD|nr:nicotinamide phosphoribosyltransferase [Brevundimonas phage vB_BgoS-Bajun]
MPALTETTRTAFTMPTYNLILDSDSYKASHFLGYPPGTQYVYSYIESRGGIYPEVMLFALQRVLHKLQQGFTLADVDEAEAFCAEHGVVFNGEGWRSMFAKYNGQVPVRIKAIDEGLLVTVRTPLVTLENTDPEFPWLTSYLETMLLRDIWYGSTVATRVFGMKKRIKAVFDRTSDNPVSPFALLDFMARGVAGYDANLIAASAYLTSFMGSDSMAGVRDCNAHYFSKMSGFSISATEHSIMCAYGRDAKGDKIETFQHLLSAMGRRDNPLSIVSDTWDIFNAVDMWCSLADDIKAAGITLVIRPDSGDMEQVLRAILPKIKAAFGGTLNSKGFMVLDSVKVLWGDGINETTCDLPFRVAEDLGIAADSIMVGSGGGIAMADMDRDTAKWAMKAAQMFINNQIVEIRKDPITDPGKSSKAGRFAVVRHDDGSFETVNIGPDEFVAHDMLGIVFENGTTFDETTIDQIRERIDAQL